MARIDINNFERISKERNNVHGTVISSYSVFEINGEKYFQIDTYRSTDKQISGKKPQTIQFDKNAAKRIVEILRKEFKI